MASRSGIWRCEPWLSHFAECPALSRPSTHLCKSGPSLCSLPAIGAETRDGTGERRLPAPSQWRSDEEGAEQSRPMSWRLERARNSGSWLFTFVGTRRPGELRDWGKVQQDQRGLVGGPEGLGRSLHTSEPLLPISYAEMGRRPPGRRSWVPCASGALETGNVLSKRKRESTLCRQRLPRLLRARSHVSPASPLSS